MPPGRPASGWTAAHEVASRGECLGCSTPCRGTCTPPCVRCWSCCTTSWRCCPGSTAASPRGEAPQTARTPSGTASGPPASARRPTLLPERAARARAERSPPGPGRSRRAGANGGPACWQSDGAPVVLPVCLADVFLEPCCLPSHAISESMFAWSFCLPRSGWHGCFAEVICAVMFSLRLGPRATQQVPGDAWRVFIVRAP
mmetsp:Transcript_67105/g.174722  ORF Transcript_67105/g.174722 Transcript_67105/m.174722 type:complete len:201 (+) Transcript_67105:1095-1697(+)